MIQTPLSDEDFLERVGVCYDTDSIVDILSVTPEQLVEALREIILEKRVEFTLCIDEVDDGEFYDTYEGSTNE